MQRGRREHSPLVGEVMVKWSPDWSGGQLCWLSHQLSSPDQDVIGRDVERALGRTIREAEETLA